VVTYSAGGNATDWERPASLVVDACLRTGLPLGQCTSLRVGAVNHGGKVAHPFFAEIVV
jgi:hypothetical protein